MSPAAKRGKKMHFALRPHLRPQAAAGHHMVNRKLQTRSQLIFLAQPFLESGKAGFKGVNHFADARRGKLHLRFPAGQSTELRGNKD